MDRNFVVMDADLSPERKLTGTKGQGLGTYRELIGNLATRTKPEGGALSLVLDRWISGIQMQVQEEMRGAASSAQPVPEEMRGAASSIQPVPGIMEGMDSFRLIGIQRARGGEDQSGGEFDQRDGSRV